MDSPHDNAEQARKHYGWAAIRHGNPVTMVDLPPIELASPAVDTIVNILVYCQATGHDPISLVEEARRKFDLLPAG